MVSSTKTGRRLALFLGASVTVILAVAIWVSWPRLQFWWTFEAVAPDPEGRSQYRHRSTGVVFVRLAPRRPTPGAGFFFDGHDDFVEVPDSLSLRFHTGVSVSCWVFLEEVKEGTIVNRWHMGREDLLLRIRADGRGEFHLYLDGFSPNVAVTTDRQLPTRRWCHLAGTYDGAAIRIYLDGTMESERREERGIRNAPCNLRIGAVHRDHTMWSAVPGRMAYVGLFERGLSSEEVRFVNGGVVPGKASGLVAYYDMGSAEGQIVPDRSGRGNHGFLGSSPDIEECDPILGEGGQVGSSRRSP